jgi:hypothetical protein
MPISAEAAGTSHGDHQGKDQLFGLRDLTQAAHTDLAFGVGGQGAHNRRLDHRHQGHIAIGRNGNRGQQLGRHLVGQENRGRAVSAADNPDGRRLMGRKAEQGCAQEGGKDAELGRSAQQKGPRVGNHRSKVGQRPHAEEDNRREEF